MADAADGVLLIDKPAGKTSHDIVAATRRGLRFAEARSTRVKVGHAGTLDPFATGLLLILVGRATRIQRHLMALPKAYEVVARLGWRSSTGDPEGEIERGAEPPEPLVLPTGTILQRPPAHSAVKVGGVRAYAAARRGEALELEAREVRVDAFELRRRDGDRATFAIECGSGTYVRSLIADLGDAYCVELRRTRIGRFDVADADPGRLIGIDDALAHLPALRLEDQDAQRAGHGVAVSAPRPMEGTVRLLDADGLVALAEARPDGTLKPVVGFRA